jgi:putative heme-binding domain-containing protein
MNESVAQYVLSWRDAELANQLTAFRSFGLATAERGGRIPQPFFPWAERIALTLLESDDPQRMVEGAQLVGALRLNALYDRVARMAKSSDLAVPVRIPAIQACVAMTDSGGATLLDTILGDPAETPELRRAAAFGLGLINTDESRRRLHTRLATAHHRLATDIAAALAGTRSGAELLLSTIADGKASPLLLREPAVHRRLEVSQVPDLSARMARLTENLPTPDAMIARLIAQRRSAYLASQPDAKLGEQAFTKHCRLCHQLAGEGKKFGPDLDGIGVRGLDRLLEDMLDPSRNVDPAFRSTIVVTDRGVTRSGLALRDEGKVLILVDPDGNELRIDHDAIDERYVSSLSPMPNAIEKALTPEEFDHVVRFLLDSTEPLKAAPDERPDDSGN